VIPVTVPPLLDRRDDILPLAHHFVIRQATDSGRQLELGAAAEKALLAHSWPGNVRELENAIERASVLSVDGVLRTDDLLLADLPSTHKADSGGALQARLNAATRDHIKGALEATRGRRGEAAARLGVDRMTLYRLMQRHGL
jgi:DNA-binding NtrC family response regulator